MLFHKDFGDEIQITRGVMLKEYTNYIVYGAYKTLWIGIGHWTIGGFNFEF
jgi:hypothetical protein